MRVLHITNAYPTEKYQSYGIFIKEQIDSLSKKGVACATIFINARDNGKFEYIRVIPKIIKASRNCDVVHCHHAYSAFVALFIARIKKPLVVSFLSTKMGEVTANVVSGYFYNRLIAKCSAYIVKNDPSIEKRFVDKAYYLPNGVDISQFREIDRAVAQEIINLEKGRYLLFSSSGGITRKEKRYDIFQKVVEILNEKYNAAIKQLLLVNVPRDKTPFYFNAASAHLLTSDYEGSPNSVKEALACNVAIISTDVGNVRAVIEDIPGCYVSSSNKPEELAALVAESLKRERVPGRQAIVTKDLSMDSVADKLASIYHKVINR